MYIISNACIRIRKIGEGNEMKYGQQRVWGTIGFGIVAVVGGYFMNNVEHTVSYSISDFYPAMYLCLFFMVLDLVFCYKLKVSIINKNFSLFNVCSLFKFSL